MVSRNWVEPLDHVVGGGGAGRLQHRCELEQGVEAARGVQDSQPVDQPVDRRAGFRIIEPIQNFEPGRGGRNQPFHHGIGESRRCSLAHALDVENAGEIRHGRIHACLPGIWLKESTGRQPVHAVVG